MEKITESQKELLAGYIVSVIVTIRALQDGQKLDDLTLSVITEVTARLCSLFGITPELMDNIKTDMDFETTFNQK